MYIPDDAFFLLGLVLAHSAYTISDQDGQLCPYVVTDKGEERDIVTFEDETQQAAIDNAVAQFDFFRHTCDRWAFAREGSIASGDKQIDVLIIEAWSREMADTVVLVQQFRPFSSGRFALVGAPEVLVDGTPVDHEERKRILELVEDGIESHPDIEDFWDTYGAVQHT